MSTVLPPPITIAISRAKSISPSLGGSIEYAFRSYWGDSGALREASQEWKEVKRSLDGSIETVWGDGGDGSLGIRQLTEEEWSGGASDAYAKWMETWKSKTLKPISDSCGEMSEALDAMAETIENDLHGKLIELARWLVMTLATAPSSGTGLGLAATVGLLLEFLQKLFELNGAYRQALKPAQDKMEDVYGKSIGVQQLTGLDLGLPTKIPFVTPSISPLLPKDIIGDWDNWEHKKPQQRDDGQFAPPPTVKPDSAFDKSPFDKSPGGEIMKKLLRGG